MKKFKRHNDYGFWDQDIRLSQWGDPPLGVAPFSLNLAAIAKHYAEQKDRI